MIGLIFVNCLHPLDQFLRTSFSFPFTSLGLVFEITIAGVKSRKVYLLDVFGTQANSFGTTNSPVYETNFEQLVQNCLLTRVWIRWLELSENQQEKIRIATGDIFSHVSKPLLKDLLRELVGLRKQVFNILDAIMAILERADIKLSNWKPQLCSQITSVSLDRQGAATFLGLLARPFSVEDHRWRGLEKLGQLEEVPLPYFDPAEKEIKLKQALSQSLPIFSEMSATFLRNFTSDSEFMLATLRRFNARCLLQNLLLESLDLNIKLLEKTNDKDSRKKLEELLIKVQEIGLLE